MSINYSARRKNNSLPYFPPNLELPLLFEPDFLRPGDLQALCGKTKAAFNKLVMFYNNECQLTISEYQSVLKLLTETEDSLVQIKLENVRLVDRKLELEKNRFRDYKLHIKDPDEIPPEVGDGDYVILRKMEDARYDLDKVSVLSITKINETYLEVRTPENFRKVLDTEKCLYEVKFRKDRTVYRFEQLAVGDVEPKTVARALFPKECGKAADPSETYNWLSAAVKTNPEQQQAVRNIVNGSAFPAPYILFGPPGTGKTTTLVEAIAQVWKNKPDANVLVCASSNYACNEILSRLMDLDCVPVEDMFRYLSKSQLRKIDTIDDRILEISNIDKNQNFNYPELDELRNKRLIFATLVTAGRLVLLKMGKSHFDYIFVDEAGSATEASTIIPISGLVAYGGFKKRNNIVLAGDPKQLGPIVLHRPAEKLMYGRSLLDRLMELELYQPDVVSKKYNAACITKLLQNFRSHKNILAIPNKLFYDNELIAKAGPNITNVALGQKFLPNTKIPIVFHAVNGITLQDADNPSLYNKEECEVVLRYVSQIMNVKYLGKIIPENEIGIISPYRRQCNELTKLLRHKMKLKDIEVGSVEQFQGQERCVIILSTVRSNTDTIGFLNNPKRLNVSITRAKALLVIVGNPKTLQLDKNWYELIKYCWEQNVCTGMKFKLKKPVRGKYTDKIRPIGIQRNLEINGLPNKITNGVDIVSKDMKRMSVSDKIVRESTKNNLTDWVNVETQSNAKDNKKPPSYTVVMHWNEKVSGSSSSLSNDEDPSEISEPQSDNNSLHDDFQRYLDMADYENIVTDDENEANFRGTHFAASEDVLTTDGSTENDDVQSTHSNEDNLCDTATNDTKLNGFTDLDFNFDAFGFVQ